MTWLMPVHLLPFAVYWPVNRATVQPLPSRPVLVPVMWQPADVAAPEHNRTPLPGMNSAAAHEPDWS